MPAALHDSDATDGRFVDGRFVDGQHLADRRARREAP